MANPIYIEYPCMRYHKTLAPEGREIKNAVDDAALGEGWVDTPAAFDPAYVAPPKPFKDGDPMPVYRAPGHEYVPYPAMRYTRDGKECVVHSEAADAALDPAVWKNTPDPKAWDGEPAGPPPPVVPPPAALAPPVVATMGAETDTIPADPPELPAEPATPSPIAASLYLLNAAEATLLINGQDTPEKLDEVEAAERAHPKHEGGRVSVLRAIADRREALAAAATP